MDHPGENHGRFEFSNQPKNGVQAKSDSTDADVMYGDSTGEGFFVGFGIRDQAQMKFVLLLGEVSREICDDFLRTAATKMRDQQEILGRCVIGLFAKIEVIERHLDREVTCLTRPNDAKWYSFGRCSQIKSAQR